MKDIKKLDLVFHEWLIIVKGIDTKDKYNLITDEDFQALKLEFLKELKDGKIIRISV